MILISGDFASFERCFSRRSLLVIYINRTQLPSSLNPSFTPVCSTPFSICQFPTFLNFCFLIFGLPLFGWLHALDAAGRTQNSRSGTKLGGRSMNAQYLSYSSLAVWFTPRGLLTFIYLFFVLATSATMTHAIYCQKTATCNANLSSINLTSSLISHFNFFHEFPRRMFVTAA